MLDSYATIQVYPDKKQNHNACLYPRGYICTKPPQSSEGKPSSIIIHDVICQIEMQDIPTPVHMHSRIAGQRRRTEELVDWWTVRGEMEWDMIET